MGAELLNHRVPYFLKMDQVPYVMNRKRSTANLVARNVNEQSGGADKHVQHRNHVSARLVDLNQK